MALNLYLQLTLNGVPLTGDVSVATIGGVNVSVNHVEAHALYHELVAQDDKQGPRSAGIRVHMPITITKRMDRATPLLARAWNQNQSVDGLIKIFGMEPATGATVLQHVYQIGGARILAIRTEVLSNLTPESAQMPPLERVTIAYHAITITHFPTAVEWAGTSGPG